MSADTTQTAAAEPGRRCYIVNILLFTAATVLYTFWFQRHLKVYVTEVLILGGTLSLLGVWKLAWDAFGTASGVKSDDLVKRLLQSPNATEYLLFSLLPIGILYACTASIYLSYSDGGGKQYKVEVWEGDRMLVAPYEVNSFDRNVGGPLFFRTATSELEYRIVEPSGFRPLTQTLRPWSQHALRVPADFKRKELHLLRLVPDPTLSGVLPATRESRGLRYCLRIRWRDAEGREQLVEQTQYWNTSVLTGMTEPDLRATATDTELAALRSWVDDHLAKMGAVEAERQPVVAQLAGAPLQLPSAELVAGTVVTIQLLGYGSDATPAEATLLSQTQYTLAGGRVHTVLIPPPGPGGSP